MTFENPFPHSLLESLRRTGGRGFTQPSPLQACQHQAPSSYPSPPQKRYILWHFPSLGNRLGEGWPSILLPKVCFDAHQLPVAGNELTCIKLNSTIYNEHKSYQHVSSCIPAILFSRSTFYKNQSMGEAPSS